MRFFLYRKILWKLSVGEWLVPVCERPLWSSRVKSRWDKCSSNPRWPQHHSSTPSGPLEVSCVDVVRGWRPLDDRFTLGSVALPAFFVILLSSIQRLAGHPTTGEGVWDLQRSFTRPLIVDTLLQRRSTRFQPHPALDLYGRWLFWRPYRLWWAIMQFFCLAARGS